MHPSVAVVFASIFLFGNVAFASSELPGCLNNASEGLPWTMELKRFGPSPVVFRNFECGSTNISAHPHESRHQNVFVYPEESSDGVAVTVSCLESHCNFTNTPCSGTEYTTDVCLLFTGFAKDGRRKSEHFCTRCRADSEELAEKYYFASNGSVNALFCYQNITCASASIDLKFSLIAEPVPINSNFCCEDGSKCIPNSLVCDGNYDCDDHSDERGCPTKDTDRSGNAGWVFTRIVIPIFMAIAAIVIIASVVVYLRRRARMRESEGRSILGPHYSST